MPGTTISSDQRDGLYERVRNHLGSAGDLVDLLEQQKDWPRPSSSDWSWPKTSA